MLDNCIKSWSVSCHKYGDAGLSICLMDFFHIYMYTTSQGCGGKLLTGYDWKQIFPNTSGVVVILLDHVKHTYYVSTN